MKYLTNDEVYDVLHYAPWLKKADFIEAVIVFDSLSNGIMFTKGIWNKGEWKGNKNDLFGIGANKNSFIAWRDGVFNGGMFSNAVWFNGIWKKGTWLNGTDKQGNYHGKDDSPDKWNK